MHANNAPMVFPAFEPSWTVWFYRLSKIIARAWVDEEYKKKLIADPRGVLAESGLIVPESVVLEVGIGESEYKLTGLLDGRPAKLIIPLPEKPSADDMIKTWYSGQPASNSAALLAAAGDVAELWVLPCAGHHFLFCVWAAPQPHPTRG